jgi:hypothetical protein
MVLLVVHTSEKRSDDYEQRWGGKQKIKFKINKMIFTDLVVKELSLRDT